ncbi:TadE/TadG family type IV pilus assembly protein [Caulobacter sp. NIBR2454]|uniref:TadE/TadG family type IV pilus assembly protein n=1 Tax=Caulobacter sp. NIBR2454 TaxID=3015996 RepID=UPI0022B6D290|nr:TadE/TadG family type IV pilus assembly protein [Caulobacter sp. NIBR2454]
MTWLPFQALRVARNWRGSDDRGAIAVEFALVSPVLFLLAFGVMIASLQLAVAQAVGYTAAEAARATVVGMTPAERQTLATDRANQVMTSFQPLLDPADMQVTYASLNARRSQVTVAYDLSSVRILSFNQFLGLNPSAAGSETVTRQFEVANGGY